MRPPPAVSTPKSLPDLLDLARPPDLVDPNGNRPLKDAKIKLGRTILFSSSSSPGYGFTSVRLAMPTLDQAGQPASIIVRRSFVGRPLVLQILEVEPVERFSAYTHALAATPAELTRRQGHLRHKLTQSILPFRCWSYR